MEDAKDVEQAKCAEEAMAGDTDDDTFEPIPLQRTPSCVSATHPPRLTRHDPPTVDGADVDEMFELGFSPRNLCAICGIDLGPQNPRQLCRKTYCDNFDWYYQSIHGSNNRDDLYFYDRQGDDTPRDL